MSELYKLLTNPDVGCYPPYGKKWRLFILPQYLANLTQPIGTKKAAVFVFANWFVPVVATFFMLQSKTKGLV